MRAVKPVAARRPGVGGAAAAGRAGRPSASFLAGLGDGFRRQGRRRVEPRVECCRRRPHCMRRPPLRRPRIRRSRARRTWCRPGPPSSRRRRGYEARERPRPRRAMPSRPVTLAATTTPRPHPRKTRRGPRRRRRPRPAAVCARPAPWTCRAADCSVGSDGCIRRPHLGRRSAGRRAAQGLDEPTCAD